MTGLCLIGISGHSMTGCLVVQRIPERIVEQAVKGMLPSGRIGRHLFTHLKVLN